MQWGRDLRSLFCCVAIVKSLHYITTGAKTNQKAENLKATFLTCHMMENKIFEGIFISASDALSLQGRVRETIPASDYNSSRPHMRPSNCSENSGGGRVGNWRSSRYIKCNLIAIFSESKQSLPAKATKLLTWLLQWLCIRDKSAPLPS